MRVGERAFSLTADVSEAHRQVPIDPRDWHLLGCQVETRGDVYIHTAGTFGAASASYDWSFFVLFASAGVLMFWAKTASGDVVKWVSSTARIRSAFRSAERHGSSNGPDKWRTLRRSTSPLLRRARARCVCCGGARIRAALCRSFVALHVFTPQKLGTIRTALRQVFSSNILHVIWKFPGTIRARLSCAPGTRPRESTRKRGEERTGIGGWAPVRHSRGELDPWLSLRDAHRPS